MSEPIPGAGAEPCAASGLAPAELRAKQGGLAGPAPRPHRRSCCRLRGLWPCAVALLIALSAACERRQEARGGVVTSAAPAVAYLEVPTLKLRLVQLPGWSQDPGVESAAAGEPGERSGLVMRLVQHSAVAGSPRVDVTVTPRRPRPMLIDEFLTQNLQEMAQLEQRGDIRMTHVEQRRVTLSGLKAYRVRHEYSVGAASAQATITQLSTFFVVDGRGVAVTAAGRTELFAPQSAAIEALMAQLQVLGGVAPATPAAPQGDELTAPVDLGKIGGRSRAP